VSPEANSRFSAEAVVALKIVNDTRRLEIKLTDTRGITHVVSIPLHVALELAGFISDACTFMTRLKKPRANSSDN
jgi:hypothetical protein